MGSLRFLLVVLSVPFASASSEISTAYADTPSGAALYEATANLFGVDKGSKFYNTLGGDDIAPASRNTSSPGGSAAPHKRGIDEEDVPLKIIRHYKVAGEGAVKLPLEKDFRNPFFKLSPEKMKAMAGDLAKVGADYLKGISDPATLPFAPRELPNCTNNSTEKKKVSLDSSVQKKLGLEPTGTKEDREVVLFDYLLLRKEDLPINPSEVFGKSVVVRVYEGKPQSAIGYTARAMGARCLPFRVRGTRTLAFRHQGFDALKNYDSQPTGSGKMHDIIKEKKKKSSR